MMKQKGFVALSWVLQVAAAGILVQAAVFKLLGAEQTVRLFETLGAEPIGRLGVGIAEVLAAALLLLPRTAALGGILGALLMVGAVGSHVTKLGVSVDGDGGTMFAMALATLAASAAVVLLRRGELPVVGARLVREAPGA